MFKTSRFVLVAGLVCALTLTGCSSASSTGTSGATDGAGSTTSQEQTQSNELKEPTDFTIDPQTGEFSFTATDENTGYYFVRAYSLRDGEESGDEVTSSQRINGGSTGKITGTLDLSKLQYGEYNIDLFSYAASGTDYETPEPVTTVIRSGVGGKLERPEFLAIASGNQAELVLDWWTLCDYNSLQYMPKVKFTFYSDEACTQVVKEDTVDTHDLLAGLTMTPPGTGYVWGEKRDQSVVRWHTSTGEYSNSMMGGGDGGATAEMKFAFTNDDYVYQLDAGTYYVTAQAISDYEYVSDSDPSTPVKVVVTSDAPSADATESMTELYEDPETDGMSIWANPDEKTDRVDAPSSQTTSREIAN